MLHKQTNLQHIILEIQETLKLHQYLVLLLVSFKPSLTLICTYNWHEPLRLRYTHLMFRFCLVSMVSYKYFKGHCFVYQQIKSKLFNRLSYRKYITVNKQQSYLLVYHKQIRICNISMINGYGYYKIPLLFLYSQCG